jgi:hypothetical protein
MQFRVNPNAGGKVAAGQPQTWDDVDGFDLTSLSGSIATAFRDSQEPIIVPQAAYNDVYNISVNDAGGQNLVRIPDYGLTYTTLNPVTKQLDTALGEPLTLYTQPKSIIEDWTLNWGRMNALLGVEVPRTTSVTQTSVPQGFVDPQTELVKLSPSATAIPMNGTAPDGTQLWRITHNGVDAHAIHFHLFHVQLINRVGWDGAVYYPDANELGWKDTIKMNPLEDEIVALRPMTMTALPFKVPNLHRPLIPQQGQNVASQDFFNWSPIDGGISTVTNQSVNFGWEYLWHCHILGHEENDMMRVISAANSPEDPDNVVVTSVGSGNTAYTQVAWTDNSMVANWVTITYQVTTTTAPIRTNTVTTNVRIPECTSQAGCQRYYRYTGTANSSTTTGASHGKNFSIVAHNTVGAGPGIQDVPYGVQVGTPSTGTGNGGTNNEKPPEQKKI